MIPQRLARLRTLMEREGVHAYLIPGTDPHHSEYLPACWKRREWMSGFTGSAGDVAVTMEDAALWTDGRYFLQAATQLEGSGIRLMRIGQPETPTMEGWLVRSLGPGQGVVGVDPRVLSVESARKLEKELRTHGMVVRYIQSNLVDELWTDRPAPSDAPVEVLGVEFAGETVADKLTRVREAMAGKGCSAHVLTALDSIAWTFNLRGRDIAYNPLFISYAVITSHGAHLFIDPVKVTEEARGQLDGPVTFHRYGEIGDFLGTLGAGTATAEGGCGGQGSRGNNRIWIDPATANQWIMIRLGSAGHGEHSPAPAGATDHHPHPPHGGAGVAESPAIHEERSPVVDLKSVKNATELQGFRDAHLQDGIAMVRFLKWLGDMVPGGTVTENSAVDKLREFRSMGEHFVGPSFATISAYGPHGAIIHYDPGTAGEETALGPEGIYLVDSGGQYRTGTTDITRTVALGAPTREQREMFTRVLRGHIGLTLTRFPSGTPGRQIEFPARKPLWDAGKNYNHGTGHGIGHYLNVHEGPFSIGPRDPGVPLRPGNVLSNEPGYYREGEYGIRIENVITVVEAGECAPEDTPMLGFETLTLCPVDLELVEPSLMTREEIGWLDSYHRRVRDALSPHLDETHRDWLVERTRAVGGSA